MKRWHIWLIAAVIVITGGLIYLYLLQQEHTAAYQGAELSGEAPDFRLTDQNGYLVSLSDFRGKVVVLTFMDSICLDTCPLTAAQFRQAYQQLDESEANQVAFIGVNVNVEANKVADVAEITRAWHLEEIPSWHFLTGNQAELKAVWEAYDVAVVPTTDENEIMHTPGIFLIDPSGQKRRYISTPDSVVLTLPLSELLLKYVRQLRQ